MGPDGGYICLTTETIKIKKFKKQISIKLYTALQLIVGVNKGERHHVCSFGLTIS